jgi:hypothetical protein
LKYDKLTRNALAIIEYIQRHRYDNVTEKLNEIYDEELSSLDMVSHDIQIVSIGKEDC